MRVKDNSVSVSRLQPAMFWALQVAQRVYDEYDYGRLVITSGDERGTRHMATSLHYAGAAVDLRTYQVDTAAVVEELDARLGIDFDVVLESDHIHIELQPRGRRDLRVST